MPLAPRNRGIRGSLGLARSLHGRGKRIYGAKTVPKGEHGGAVRGGFVFGVWGMAPEGGSGKSGGFEAWGDKSPQKI
jgi:hypothetical protein